MTPAGGLSAAVVGRVLDATHNNYTQVLFAGAGPYVAAALAFISPCRGTAAI